ncbi:hypothetical protein ACWDMR_32400 [Streptomyces althioticus]|uniref:GIY-YIG nuclease family protein n=1 Tax=Streptomyces griseorubens TaxID=66897 RepID=A0ABR4ST46_9ACTN|nr:hypothetical protein [Streptomyces griseorubens]KEG37886.1 hypothetical protein DJ64_24395 [Streptomyces griseorubens]
MTRPTVLPVGPVLTRRALGALPLAAGRYLVAAYATPVPFHDYGVFTDLGVVTGIYLVTDAENHIRWLGQASRDDDLSARLGEHRRNPHKRAVFAHVRVLHLEDHTPGDALNAIEGKCADRLNLRGAMNPRVWPRADEWLRLVA